MVPIETCVALAKYNTCYYGPRDIDTSNLSPSKFGMIRLRPSWTVPASPLPRWQIRRKGNTVLIQRLALTHEVWSGLTSRVIISRHILCRGVSSTSWTVDTLSQMLTVTRSGPDPELSRNHLRRVTVTRQQRQTETPRGGLWGDETPKGGLLGGWDP